MTLFETSFAAVAGGVTGRDHRRAHRDGQDGAAIVRTPAVTGAIVTDGCSSGRASEVGARLGAAWLADLVASCFSEHQAVVAAREVTSGLIDRLRGVARAFRREDDAGVVGDLFLFGFLAAVVTEREAIVFGVGDGIATVDGRTTVIDPGPDNAPSYAAYALLGAPIAPNVIHVGPASEVDTLAVATDGASVLLEPGADSSWHALLRDERVLANPSLLRKRLIVLSEHGRFQDDATIGLVRRLA